jgi:hypothetical protein
VYSVLRGINGIPVTDISAKEVDGEEASVRCSLVVKMTVYEVFLSKSLVERRGAVSR